MENYAPPTAAIPNINKILSEAIASGQAKTPEDIHKILDQWDARCAFIAHNMKDIPTAYTAQMPNTGDTDQLTAAEWEIRKAYEREMKALGFKHPETSGIPHAALGRPPATGIDYLSRSPLENISDGLRGK